MTVLKFVVSACLAGVRCRYNGEAKLDKKIFQMVKKGEVIPLCPEQLSGLSTPRKTATIEYSSGRKKIASISGEDLSQFFSRGANLSFRIAKRFKINSAWLKEGSPSCGFGLKTGREDSQKKTMGITSSLLLKKGMRISPK
ncbi:MAG: DUF523 domain-containing protein [candidate division Zixibacteria bacterium]|nr:DUF523 domain-containing protein [candidate division Zixibacteria bacterium]